ncbi:hypothetical protein E5163_10850 [Marinicauda algicola]|uniref:DUF306 domain-containing protein n=1 Tax=Marinicauda algicola TaxID=2029849 RepID=A0A4S2GZ00_9PROT|nr:hypothetical protein [Marinicauda algicola]TGY88313.1 hypothetical protein E5163_10850 [Marinicauda algicola]
MRGMRLVLAAATSGLALAACGSPPEPREAPEPLEPVLTWYVEDDALFVRAQSGGCTNESSFEPHVYLTRDWIAEIELERVEDDECEAFMPNGVLLRWTREQLGIPETAVIELENPTRARAPRAG